jgi:hypothetical protein
MIQPGTERIVHTAADRDPAVYDDPDHLDIPTTTGQAC